jgi:hypothetical protein
MDGIIRQRQLVILRRHLTACRRLRAWREAEALLPLLAAIADPELRLHRFGEHLGARSPEEAAWTIARLQEMVAEGNRQVQRVSLGLLDKRRLARVVPPEAWRAVEAALHESGHRSARLFAEERRPAEAPDDEVVPRPAEPVGSRISQARRPVPLLIERLLFDPDARVVQVVLGNPRLTEAEVVKLAASRRASPECLEAIAESDRWIARYAVKVALASNPATPARLALGLLPYLLRQDLRELASRATRAEVRDEAAALLRQRPGE